MERSKDGMFTLQGGLIVYECLEMLVCKVTGSDPRIPVKCCVLVPKTASGDTRTEGPAGNLQGILCSLRPSVTAPLTTDTIMK